MLCHELIEQHNVIEGEKRRFRERTEREKGSQRIGRGEDTKFREVREKKRATEIENRILIQIHSPMPSTLQFSAIC